ncbi:MAG: 30S ribosomal protein S8 [Candidatus Nealsonbacteria bacterium CG_4_9_14_3_um_filter_35_11]|uniref:Small ribosomal subunit protein uS8 n=1 Tax=Candidatus Nealsonbacteria bacterium CG11_big_fil_rev_8_21_14_0_20_35_11 TaxID=1974713 RepID=A0A2H0N1G9_9BACT|nr:MAG: 30S ribosomal protein S8 [Candidatus Nealsonbacteria bacterium CG11_big_fil_rev_8_21_14_0_20_35_11]PIW92816.1 MAG: 30S ribosomal protein S8 [Candidatus Nealsonbacteria bacterium CG_4_8_14_3_um_filter_34_13]PIZ90121.1 MAG: 30S ribosomal protein S8 [Candidatus Nealsonbacteria bacterium CG_4_10_14_0_2_um_filter_35_20]PJA84438.1 MAG: 30S ribosomal protein S8 [Candidatus Nealsonbacteria bacterium CG_4_9_14_3_um_filter_35_11]
MDPIADMLNSINNAQAIAKSQVVISPFSKLKFEILQLLKKENFILDVKKKGKGIEKKIIVDLKYNDGSPAISKIRKISKPGRRVYLPVKKIKKVKSGYGIAIISTSSGLTTNKEAKKRKLGGEVICELW